jgi:hypothetical protein
VKEGNKFGMMVRRINNEGHQADDEDETFRDSEISLALFGKKF